MIRVAGWTVTVAVPGSSEVSAPSSVLRTEAKPAFPGLAPVRRPETVASDDDHRLHAIGRGAACRGSFPHHPADFAWRARYRQSIPPGSVIAFLAVLWQQCVNVDPLMPLPTSVLTPRMHQIRCTRALRL